MTPQLNPLLAERATDGLAGEYRALLAEHTALQERVKQLTPQVNGLRSELIHRTYEVPCPKHRCRAEAGDYCVNLNTDGVKRYPHAERITAYFAAVGIDEPRGLTWDAP